MPGAEESQRFIDACAKGDLTAVRAMLAQDPSLVNVRDTGDNASGLHWSAAHGHMDVARALLDAGADPQGAGDLHEMDVIGWVTALAPPHSPPRDEIIALLLERGATHHIFSAIALGDLALVRQVAQTPKALERRMSRFENGMTPLHFALARERPDIAALLIELGANVEATDDSGQTPLAVAMSRGDRESMRALKAAGAKEPPSIDATEFTAKMAALAGSTTKSVPAIGVPNVVAAIEWYTSIGFTELARFEDGGDTNFGMVAFGKAELMFNVYTRPEPHEVGLWFYTDKVDELYALVKARQLTLAKRILAGELDETQGIVITEELYTPFYASRQFSFLDLNGYNLLFIKE